MKIEVWRKANLSIVSLCNYSLGKAIAFPQDLSLHFCRNLIGNKNVHQNPSTEVTLRVKPVIEGLNKNPLTKGFQGKSSNQRIQDKSYSLRI